MMNTSKLNKWGNSTGVILPKHLLQHVGMKTGDVVSISVNSNTGTIELTKAAENVRAKGSRQ